MAATLKDGPDFTYGSMSAMLLSTFGVAVPDPNSDAGPNEVYQGIGFLDPRYWFAKDKVTGFAGVVPAHFMMPVVRSVGVVPTALNTASIAAAQNTTSGTALTLVSSSTPTLGVVLNIPIFPFSGANINGPGANVAATIAPIGLDFGFAYGSTTAASATVTVADSSNFSVGMPIVIAGAGSSAGTAPLLTNVATIVSATSITVGPNLPAATVTSAAIGTGNIWQPNEAIYLPGQGVPTAALPFLAAGPSLFLDPRQSLCRGVSITGVSGGAGGAFLVKGWDVYGVPLSDTVTVGAGAVTAYSLKTFKYIASVTPQFTDAHNYSVGTSDVFGLNYRSGIWDDLKVTWASALMTSITGFVAPDATTPATAATGDVRGTIQVSANGGGSGIGGTASNGSLSSRVVTGNRLVIVSTITMVSAVAANPSNYVSLFGVTQA